MAVVVHSLVLMWLIHQSEVVAQCASDEILCTTGNCTLKAEGCFGNIDCDGRPNEKCCVRNSNSGQEFVLGFMSNPQGKAKLYLFITSLTALNYSVNAPYHGIAQTGSLQANELVTIHINSHLEMTTGITNNGILVTSTKDITVYGLNQVKHSTDAFLGLPTYVQGHEYLVASYTERNRDDRSLLAIVGIHNNTQVTIHLSSEAFDGEQSHSANDSPTYHIHWMQTLQLEGRDLTGSRIVSNETIAVFSGHECANVPVDQSYCDHLVEQIPPIATLGQQFITVPLATRSAGDIFRAVASQNHTDVDVNGARVASSLRAGEFVEFTSPSASYRFVNASAPILLVQFSLGSLSDKTDSDPFMLMIPPLKQYRSYYVVSTPSSHPVNFDNFFAITVPKGQESGMLLDGQPLELHHSISWNNISSLDAQLDYIGANLRIKSGSHIMKHTKKVEFGLNVYGFARDDSYGYPGGLQLAAHCDDQVTQDVDECAANNGRGPCQQLCNNTIGFFQCSCMDGFRLLPNMTSCEPISQPCNCSNNGDCLVNGNCRCQPGWEGPKCTEHVCSEVNDCSDHGQCIGPNKCECDKDWTGPSCYESTCPLHSNCSTCSSSPNSSCGWCEGALDGKCMPGNGTNPTIGDCNAWFFNHCVTVDTTEMSTTESDSRKVSTTGRATTEAPTTERTLSEVTTTHAERVTTEAPTTEYDCGKSCPSSTSTDSRTAANPGEFLWHAMLCSPLQGHFCSGVVVGCSCIITAAHCVVQDGVPNNNFTVCVGQGEHCGRCSQTDPQGHSRCFRPLSITPHHNFIPFTLNDIAVIKLRNPILCSYNSVIPVCLPNKTQDGSESSGGPLMSSFVTGWEKVNSSNSPSECLRKTEVRLITSYRGCEVDHRTYRINGSPIKCGVCAGDNGGPLIQRLGDKGHYVLAGIVSWMKGCGTARETGVYTHVFTHLDWVEQMCKID